MAGAGTINIKLAATTSSFEAGIKKVNGLLGDMSGMLGIVKAAATGFLAWKATGFIRDQMAAIDSTAKLADRLGLTTESMVGLQHAGDLAGVSAETVATSLEKMGKNLSDVSEPTKAVTNALAAMGLEMKDIQGLTPEAQLGKIADGLEGMAGSGDRTAAAMALMGKSGAQMLPMLMDGADGLADMQKEAEALGLTFNRMDAFKVEQANDALSRVGAVFNGAFRSAAIAIAPTIEAIATSFVDSAKAAGGFGAIATSVMDGVKRGAGIVGDAWNVLLAAWHAGKVALNMVGMGAANAADATMHAVQYMSGLWGNWVQLVQDSTRLLTETFGWLWAKAKQPIADFVNFTGQQLAKLLTQAADASMRLKGSLSTELRAAAGAIQSSTGTASAEAQRAVESAAAGMKTAGGGVKASWSNLFNIQTTGSPMMQQLAEGFRLAGESSAVSFSESFAAVLNQDASAGVEDWFAKIEALSAANAEASAARVAARMQIDKDFGDQQVADSEARESYLTEMFGNQAEKRLKWDKHTLDQRLSYTSNILGNLATLQNTSSRKMFEVGKIAAYANAVVSTAAGIARQFADLPIYAAIPAAAAVAVAGAVQIASIASTSFGGGGSVSSAGGSIPLVNGEPAGTQMANQGAIQPSVNRLEVNVSGLDDDALVSGRTLRNIIQGINEAQRDGSPIDRVDVRAA